MELDDLKRNWKKSDYLQTINNQNIMKLIQHKSYGPVDALKRSLKRQIMTMIIVPVVITLTNLEHIEKTMTSVLFWSYIAFCAGIVVFARLNYRILNKMEDMTGATKANLQQKIHLVETRFKNNIMGFQVALLFFIVLTEVLPFFQEFSMLTKWHSLSPIIRFGIYAVLILLQHFVIRAVNYRKFGQHLDYLKKLVADME